MDLSKLRGFQVPTRRTAPVNGQRRVLIFCHPEMEAGIEHFYRTTGVNSWLKWEELAWVRHSSTWEEYLDKFKCLEAKCREKPWKSPGSNLRHQIA